MSGISLKIDGFEDVLNNLKVTDVRAKSFIQRSITTAAQKTYNVSQTMCPVDKGDLKASGTLDTPSSISDHMESSVTYSTDHCWYIELGTRKMPAQPFLYPAFAFAASEFAKGLLRLTDEMR